MLNVNNVVFVYVPSVLPKVARMLICASLFTLISVFTVSVYLSWFFQPVTLCRSIVPFVHTRERLADSSKSFQRQSIDDIFRVWLWTRIHSCNNESTICDKLFTICPSRLLSHWKWRPTCWIPVLIVHFIIILRCRCVCTPTSVQCNNSDAPVDE